MTEFKRGHFGFYQPSSRKLKPNLRKTWGQDRTYNKSSGYHSMSSQSWIKHIPEPVSCSVISSSFNCNYGETGDQGDELVLQARPESADIKEELIDDEGSEYVVPDRGGKRRRRGGGLRKQRKRCPEEDPILSADSEFVLYQDLSDSDMRHGRRRTFEKSNACKHIFQTFSECYPIPSTIHCIAPTTLFNLEDDFSCSCLLPQKGSRRRPNCSQGVTETSSEQCPRSSFTYSTDDDCCSSSLLPGTSAFDYRASVITSRRIDHGDDRGHLPVIDEISTSEISSSPHLETLESKVVIKDTTSLGEVHFDFYTKTSVTQPVQSDTLVVTCRSSSSHSGFHVSGYVSLTPVDELPSLNTACECDTTICNTLCKTTGINESKTEIIAEDTGCGKQSVTKLAEHNSSESNLAALKLVILHSIDFGNLISEELDSKEGAENTQRKSSVLQIMSSGGEQEPPVKTNFGIDLGVNSGKESGSCHNLKNEDEFHSAVDLKISEELCPITGENVQYTGPVSQYSSASACNPQGHCVHEPRKKQSISSSCTNESFTKESCTKESNKIQSEVKMHIPVEKSPNSKTKIVFVSPAHSSKPLITQRQDRAIIDGATQPLDHSPGTNIVKQTVSSVYYRDTKYVRLNTPLTCDQLPTGESTQSVGPKDDNWCRSMVQVQITLEPIPKSDSKAALEAPPMVEDKRQCTQLSKPSDNTPGGKADLHDYLKQYCDNSDKEERIYVIVVPSRISIEQDTLQMNNPTRVVSDHCVDTESALSCTPCKAGQLSLQSSEQTPDVPCTSAPPVTHRSRVTLILPENENSEIVSNKEESEKATTCEERKLRFHPDDVTGPCPPPVSAENIADTEKKRICTSKSVRNKDQCLDLPNEDNLNARMRNFMCRTECLKNKINEVAYSKQSRGVSQMPPPPPRKDDRFLINESSTYRPGPWPAQAKPLEPPLASRIKKKLIDVAAEVREIEEEISKLLMHLEERKLLGKHEREMISKTSVPSIQKKSTIKREIPSKRAGDSRIASEMPPLLVEDSSGKYTSKARIYSEIPSILDITADSLASTRMSSVRSPVRSGVASKFALEMPDRSKVAEGLQATTRKPSGNVEESPVCSGTSLFSRPLGTAEVPNAPLSLSRMFEMLPDWSKLLARISDILPVSFRPKTASVTSEGKSLSSSRLEKNSRVKSRVSKSFKEESSITPTKLSKTEVDSLLRSRIPSKIKEESARTLASSESQIRPTRSFNSEQLRGSRTFSKIDKISPIKARLSSTEKVSAIGSRKPSSITVEFPVKSKAWAKTGDKSPGHSVSGKFQFRSEKPFRIENETTIKSKRPKYIEGSTFMSRTMPMIAREITSPSRTLSRTGEGSPVSLRRPSRTEGEFPFMSRRTTRTEEAKPPPRGRSTPIFQLVPVRSRTPLRTEEGFPVISRKLSEISREFPLRFRMPSGTDEDLPIMARKPSNFKEVSLIRLRSPSRTKEEFPRNSRTSLWTDEVRPITRRRSSPVAKEIPVRLRTPSMIGEESLEKYRRPSGIREELSIRSRTPSWVEEELPISSRTQSRIGKVMPVRPRAQSGVELPVRSKTPSRTEEVLPIRRRTPSISEEELPMWSRTQSNVKYDLPIMRKTPLGVEEEFPSRRRTHPRAEEAIPIRQKSPSSVKERSTISRRRPSRSEEEFPFQTTSSWSEEESSSGVEEEFPLMGRTPSWAEEEIPIRPKTSSRVKERATISRRRPSRSEKEFPFKTTSPWSEEESSSGVEEEFPLMGRTPSWAEEKIPIRSKTSSSVKERSTISRRRPSRSEEEFPFKTISTWSEEESSSGVEEKFPFRGRTPSWTEEEVPIRPKTSSSVKERSTISRRKPSRSEEEFPFKTISTWSEEESPTRRTTSSKIAEELSVRPLEPPRIEEDMPISLRRLSMVEEQESPIRLRNSSRVTHGSLSKPRSASLFEDIPLLTSISSGIADGPPISPKRRSVKEESLIRSSVPLRITEESPVSSRRPSGHESPSVTEIESPITSRNLSNIDEGLPTIIRIPTAIQEQESPLSSKTSSQAARGSLTRPRSASLFEDVPLRASISSRIAEEPPISPKRRSVKEESLIRSSVPLRITEESPISSRRPSVTEIESPITSRNLSNIDERLPTMIRIPTAIQEQESPLSSKTSSQAARGSLTRPRSASLFEDVPLPASISSRIAEEPPISPKRPSVREGSFIRSSVPTTITEESPVSSRRPSSVPERSPVSSRRSSKTEEDAERPRESTKLFSNVQFIDTNKEGGLTSEQWGELDRMIQRYDKWTDDVKEESDQHD